MSGAGLRFQARWDKRIQQLGSSWVCKETGKTFKALQQALAPNDMPIIDNEGYANNINELNPLQLTGVERSADLQPGQNIHRVQSGDPAGENYICESVDQMYLGDVPIRTVALIYRAPVSRQ